MMSWHGQESPNMVQVLPSNLESSKGSSSWIPSPSPVGFLKVPYPAPSSLCYSICFADDIQLNICLILHSLIASLADVKRGCMQTSKVLILMVRPRSHRMQQHCPLSHDKGRSSRANAQTLLLGVYPERDIAPLEACLHLSLLTMVSTLWIRLTPSLVS